jgi:hypothetical protein
MTAVLSSSVPRYRLVILVPRQAEPPIASVRKCTVGRCTASAIPSGQCYFMAARAHKRSRVARRPKKNPASCGSPERRFLRQIPHISYIGENAAVPRRERPRGCRAAEQRDEVAPSHVEHGAPPLGPAPPSNDHQPADGPCSRFAPSSVYHGVDRNPWDRPNCSESNPDRCCPTVVSLKLGSSEPGI